MSVEWIGRILFNRIRLPFFLALISFLPLCAGFCLFKEKQSVEILQEQLRAASYSAKTAFARKERKEKFLALHTNVDPNFLDKEVESLHFLAKEKDRIKNWLSHPAASNKEPLFQRIQFLESGDNKLAFTEEEIQISKTAKETFEKQRAPIELDGSDLKNLLGKIEDPQGPCPQLLITEFSLEKKTGPLQNEIFEMKMDLLKREFL